MIGTLEISWDPPLLEMGGELVNEKKGDSYSWGIHIFNLFLILSFIHYQFSFLMFYCVYTILKLVHYIHRFYKGLPPLWMRQIPYTMMKFACFERTVEALYKYVVPKPRSECSKSEQLVVTFAAGYIAGVFCAVVSHPADTVVSKLNNDVGSTPIQAARDLGMKGMLKLTF